MTLMLDPPLRHGATRIWVLCERVAQAAPLPQGIAAHGRKTPAAVVIDDGDGPRAFDLAGRPLDLATLEGACPGLIAATTSVSP